MSLPANPIWNRYAQVNLEGRLFTYPPFSIEFSQSLKIGKMTTTKCTLYNPSTDTIKTAEPRGTTLKSIIIDAGFESDWGTTCIGQINDFKVKKQGPDILLELSIGDITQKWANTLVCQSWKNSNASTILSEILASAGISSKISLGTSKTYRTFSARTLKGALKKITNDTDSQFYFKNGVLKIEPKDPPRERQVLYLSSGSGLLDRIEKTKKGFNFKTVYFYKIQPGDIVLIEDFNTPATYVKITEGKKKFSTFGNSECSFKAKEI